MIVLILFTLTAAASGQLNSEAGNLQGTLFTIKRTTAEFELMKAKNSAASPTGANLKKPRQKDAKPLLLSVLIPGAGQYYNGDKKKAAVFFGIELTLWGAVYGINAYSGWIEDDYKAFALQNAGIDLSGKDHQYFVDIGNYMNREQFNDQQLIERDYDSMYLDSAYNWQWDSDSDRQRFKDLRIRSDSIKNTVFFVSGAIVLNHLISGIEAAKSADKKNKISAGISSGPNGSKMLTIIKEF
ncbi:hypothetical protein ISS30_00365 [bacterium]|nr:hypothetical protein [FCB group bacterium]MBL7190123.1 hypothetical protein [bacterium]